MELTINDKQSYSITSRTMTDDGFMIVPGHTARTGVQEYLAKELGLDGDPYRIIRVMRPETEVFAKDSLDSYAGVDVTIEHPNDLVNADSYNTVTAGVVKTVGIQDGDFVKCELIVKSKDAINAINSGKVQLSAGYRSVYKDAPADADYDYIQTAIRINHVALVDNARAGAQARIFDNQLEIQPMIKVALDSGREIEIEDKAIAALVTDSIDRLKKQVTDAEEKSVSAELEADKMKDELEEEKKKSSDAAITTRIAEVNTVLNDAKIVAGDSFTCDSVDVNTIRTAAVKAARPNLSLDSKSSEYIATAFDALKDLNEKKDEDEDEKENKDQLANIANDSAVLPTNKVSDARIAAMNSKSNAWKGK